MSFLSGSAAVYGICIWNLTPQKIMRSLGIGMRTWKWHPGIGASFWKPSFSGYMLNLGNVGQIFANLVSSPDLWVDPVNLVPFITSSSCLLSSADAECSRCRRDEKPSCHGHRRGVLFSSCCFPLGWWWLSGWMLVLFSPQTAMNLRSQPQSHGVSTKFQGVANDGHLQIWSTWILKGCWRITWISASAVWSHTVWVN